MNIKEWVPGEKGTVMLPMKKNIPNPKNNWELTTCPVCGQECWTSKAHKETIKIGKLDYACTECALLGGNS